MQLSDNTEKMQIVERLVKEGAIDFTEAIKLLEKEPEFISMPVYPQPPFQPFQPFQPLTPIDDNWWNIPYNPLNPPIVYATSSDNQLLGEDCSLILNKARRRLFNKTPTRLSEN